MSPVAKSTVKKSVKKTERSARTQDAFIVICQSNLLSYIAGFVDVVGFVALFGLFTNHVTGNIVMIGASLIDFSEGLVSKLAAIPVFVFMVAFSRALMLYYHRRGTQCWRLLFMIQIACLSLFMLLGLESLPIHNADRAIPLIAGMMGVAAMSIQNAQARLINPAQVPTTVMTGNITQAVIDTVDILSKHEETYAIAKKRLQIIGPAIFAFMAGAITGAFAFKHFSFWCLFLPITILISLVIQATCYPPLQASNK